MGKVSNLNESAIAKKDYELSDGRIISVGVNFRSLQLLTAYEGGFDKLSEDMESDDITLKLDACGYVLYSLIRASGEAVSQEEACMMIDIQDFDKLFEIFQDYSDAVQTMQKKTNLKQKKLKK